MGETVRALGMGDGALGMGRWLLGEIGKAFAKGGEATHTEMYEMSEMYEKSEVSPA